MGAEKIKHKVKERNMYRQEIFSSLKLIWEFPHTLNQQSGVPKQRPNPIFALTNK